ncbi:MAG: hypothetical protein BAJALOKI2v1_110067 [Promethearchaeota archaeon]|nr:MAG: hypothetical protein BAJALOKI2v1_110067 [Candidatus Lokiarchaeota archaeon]
MIKIVNIIPYLLVSNGKEAISLYKRIFNAKLIEHRPLTLEMGKSMGFPEDFDYENSTMHAVMEIGGAKLYLADNNQNTKDYGHVEITLELDTKDQINDIYHKAMDNESKALLELMEQDWGWYGRIKDKFGVVWQLNFIKSS